MKILCLIVSGLLLACAPEERLPAEPEQIGIDQDGLLDMVDEVWPKPKRPKRYKLESKDERRELDGIS